MDNKPRYPLEEIIEIKHKRVDEALKVMLQRKEEYEKQLEILKKKQEDRDQVQKHLIDKLIQLRHTMDEESTSDKLINMKQYLKHTAEKLKEENKKVEEQEKVTKEAETKLQEAKAVLTQKRKEVEKIEAHRDIWLKQMEHEIAQMEEKQSQEIGSIMYEHRRIQRKET